MLAIAIQNTNASYDFIQNTQEYVLAVPGTSMVAETLFCGTRSAREFDKPRELQLALIKSNRVAVPGLEKAIANIEMRKAHSLKAGDHIILVGEAASFRVNLDRIELPLLSIGPETLGYRVLAHKGIHRIGTVVP
jgi:flavin reductase (DIM6/NTAB) family NADH-FMN oxidoreductase RutF